MISWQFLLLGTFGAVGLALAVGTLAALAQFRRHGHFPSGQPGDPPPSRGQLLGMWARVVVGLVLAAAGIAALVTNNLL